MSVLDTSNTLEGVTCEQCHHINLVKRMPMRRREKPVQHARVADSTWTALKKWSEDFGNVDNGIAMALYYADKYLTETYKKKFEDIQVKEVDRSVISESEQQSESEDTTRQRKNKKNN